MCIFFDNENKCKTMIVVVDHVVLSQFINKFLTSIMFKCINCIIDIF